MVERVLRPGCFGNAVRSTGALRDDNKEAGDVGRSLIEAALSSDDFETLFRSFWKPSVEALLELWFSEFSLRRPPLGVAEVWYEVGMANDAIYLGEYCTLHY